MISEETVVQKQLNLTDKYMAAQSDLLKTAQEMRVIITLNLPLGAVNQFKGATFWNSPCTAMDIA